MIVDLNGMVVVNHATPIQTQRDVFRVRETGARNKRYLQLPFNVRAHKIEHKPFPVKNAKSTCFRDDVISC